MSYKLCNQILERQASTATTVWEALAPFLLAEESDSDVTKSDLDVSKSDLCVSAVDSKKQAQ